jgi:hypothetical protein
VDEEEMPPSPTAVSSSSPSRGGFVGGEPRERCLRRPDSFFRFWYREQLASPL